MYLKEILTLTEESEILEIDRGLNNTHIMNVRQSMEESNTDNDLSIINKSIPEYRNDITNSNPEHNNRMNYVKDLFKHKTCEQQINEYKYKRSGEFHHKKNNIINSISASTNTSHKWKRGTVRHTNGREVPYVTQMEERYRTSHKWKRGTVRHTNGREVPYVTQMEERYRTSHKWKRGTVRHTNGREVPYVTQMEERYRTSHKWKRGTVRHTNGRDVPYVTQMEERYRTSHKWKRGTVLIASDTMINNINERRLSKNRNVKVRCFPGSSIHDMYSYLTPLLNGIHLTWYYMFPQMTALNTPPP